VLSVTIDDVKRFKAAVIGGTGYGGAELIRRLLIHPEVELVRVVAVDHVGEPLGAVHPPLTGRSPLRFENVPPEEAARGARRGAAGASAQGERRTTRPPSSRRA
jgi:N-acetyl-gamma-glutamylphosphate reductase